MKSTLSIQKRINKLDTRITKLVAEDIEPLSPEEIEEARKIRERKLAKDERTLKLSTPKGRLKAIEQIANDLLNKRIEPERAEAVIIYIMAYAELEEEK